MKSFVVLLLLVGLTFACRKSPNKVNELIKGEWVDANKRYFNFHSIKDDTGVVTIYSKVNLKDSSSHPYRTSAKSIFLKEPWHGHSIMGIKRLKKNSLTIVTGIDIRILSRP